MNISKFLRDFYQFDLNDVKLVRITSNKLILTFTLLTHTYYSIF